MKNFVTQHLGDVKGGFVIQQLRCVEGESALVSQQVNSKFGERSKPSLTFHV